MSMNTATDPNYRNGDAPSQCMRCDAQYMYCSISWNDTDKLCAVCIDQTPLCTRCTEPLMQSDELGLLCPTCFDDWVGQD